MPPSKNSNEFAETLNLEHHTRFKDQGDKPPWLNEGEPPWSTCRIWIAKVVRSKYVEDVLIIIILFNVGLIIFETDQVAKCYLKFTSSLDACPTSYNNISWLKVANTVILATYTLDAVGSIYALRRLYFQSPTHMLDLLLCVVGWLPHVGVHVPRSSSLFRVFRCGRVLKASKFVRRYPELFMLIHAFVGSMRAMFFGTLVLIALLCFFSILTVQFLHPINCQIKYEKCTRCPRVFQSIADSMLTLYQTAVIGVDWGEIGVPVVEENRVGLLLPAIQLVLGLGAMNLILAVIVQQAMRSSENDRIAKAEKSAAEHKLRKLHLLETIREVDCDKSGDIDLDEIYNSLQTNVDLQSRLALAGLRSEEIEEILQALTSTGNNNSMSYASFGNLFDDIDAADIRKTVVLTKLMLSNMHRDINDRLEQHGVALASMSRKIDQIIDLDRAALPPRSIHEVHAPERADTEHCERMTSFPWSPHHQCPSSVLKQALDSHLGNSITDAIISWEAELDSANKSAQQSLMQLDATLHTLEEGCQCCVESNEFHGFEAQVLAHAVQTHQTVVLRRMILKDFMNAFQNELSCTLETSKTSGNVTGGLQGCSHLTSASKGLELEFL